jgi:hypothetical protein
MRTNRPWRRRRSAGAVRTGNEWPENKNWEVRYEAKKTGKTKSAVKRATKKAGPSRRKVERQLGR